MASCGFGLNNIVVMLIILSIYALINFLFSISLRIEEVSLFRRNLLFEDLDAYEKLPSFFMMVACFWIPIETYKPC